MANELAYMSDDELLARLGPVQYRRLASLGMLGEGRGSIRANNVPGLPSPEEVYSPPVVATNSAEANTDADYDSQRIQDELDYVNSFQGDQEPAGERGRRVPYAQRFGENDENVFMRLNRGRERASYALTKVLDQQAEDRANATERLLRAGRDSVPGATRGERVTEAPHEVLSSLFGVQVTPEMGLRTQILAEATGLPAEQAFKLALAEARGVGGRGRGRNQGLSADLLQQIAVAGEISPDPVISSVEARLNQQLQRVDGGGGTDDMRDVDSMARDDRAFSASPLDVIRAEVLASAAQDAASRAEGSQLRPYRQLTEEQTKRLAERSGKDRTKKRLPDEAVVMRAPGSVLSAGMEFDPRSALIPLLVAPKVLDPRTGELRIQEVYLGKDPRGKAQFSPTLTKAGVAYVNPYAELPNWVVKQMGLDPVVKQPDKDITGAQDAKLLNVPIPDVGQSRYGLVPTEDPGHGVRGEALTRNPTFAEAVRSLLLRHSTPIKDYSIDMLEKGGRGTADRVDGREVFALGGRRDPSTGKPLPIEEYARDPGREARRMNVVTGEALPTDGEFEPSVASVRVGSRKKYQDSLWADLDALVTAMIAQRIEDKPGEAPAQRYGLMLNVPPNAVRPELVRYQRALLEEAGVPIPGNTRSPLQEVLAFAAELASSPPPDQSMRQPLLLASEAEPLVSQDGRYSRSRDVQDVKQRVLARSRTPSNAAMTLTALEALEDRMAGEPLVRRMDSRGQYYLPGMETSRESYPLPAAEAEAPAAPVRQALGQLALDLAGQEALAQGLAPEAPADRQLQIPGVLASVPTLGWPRDVEAGAGMAGRPFTRPQDSPGTPSWPTPEGSDYEQIQLFPRVTEGPARPGSAVGRVRDPEALERMLDARARALGWTGPRRR